VVVSAVPPQAAMSSADAATAAPNLTILKGLPPPPKARIGLISRSELVGDCRQ